MSDANIHSVYGRQFKRYFLRLQWRAEVTVTLFLRLHNNAATHQWQVQTGPTPFVCPPFPHRGEKPQNEGVSLPTSHLPQVSVRHFRVFLQEVWLDVCWLKSLLLNGVFVNSINYLITNKYSK